MNCFVGRDPRFYSSDFDLNWCLISGPKRCRDPRNGPLARLGYFMLTQIVMIDAFYLFIYFLTTSFFDFINDSLMTGAGRVMGSSGSSWSLTTSRTSCKYGTLS